MNGGNHGDSSLVHLFETEEPLFVILHTSPFEIGDGDLILFGRP